MNNQIPSSELLNIPFITHVPSDGRSVNLSYFDYKNQEWYFHIPIENKLQRMQGGEVIVGTYLAGKSANDKCDFEFTLGTLVHQHLSYPKIVHYLNRIENIINRYSSVLEKYDLIAKRRPDDQLGACVLIESELEYLIFLVRSLFDFLQMIVKEICTKLVVIGPKKERAVKKDLKTSFADMILSDNKIRTKADIMAKWDLPEPLAAWYESQAKTFAELRALRDGIIHHGRDVGLIFSTDWGFAVNPQQKPWSSFDIWNAEPLWDNRLGSVRSIFRKIITHSLDTTSNFSTMIKSMVVQLPTAIAGDSKLYLRNRHSHWLLDLEKIRENPWEAKP